MLPARGWIYMLVPVIGLGIGEAHADKKMDWTPFLEPASSRPAPKQAAPATEAGTTDTAAKPAKAKPAKKKPTAAAQKPKRKAPVKRK